ncbi:MAG: YkgJ family cysteine cluster protein [Candidatus Poribacteria bacterium]|nr:YkgJ family cysteine cluster protein [Candidatus Poribacteria bacterium]
MRGQRQLQQIVPSEVCFSCDVCCRFLEPDSFLAPIFTEAEVKTAVEHGIAPDLFRPTADGKSAQITLKPHRDMYICPCFDPRTNECTIYPVRPLDCQIYPFALMVNEDQTQIVLGVDMLCPYGEAQIQTEPFQRYIDHIANYLESEPVVETIAANWSLIGPYQETVVVLRPLEKLSRALAHCRLKLA